MNKVGSQKKSVITRKYKMYVSISALSKPSMYVYNEGYFSCDLRDFQYPFVLRHTFELLSALYRIHSATRHVLVASTAKDCRNTRIIERVKRYVILFIFVFIHRNVYNQR